MRTLVESLKRLYEAGRLTEAQVIEREQKGTISTEKRAYILEV